MVKMGTRVFLGEEFCPGSYEGGSEFQNKLHNLSLLDHAIDARQRARISEKNDVMHLGSAGSMDLQAWAGHTKAYLIGAFSRVWRLYLS